MQITAEIRKQEKPWEPRAKRTDRAALIPVGPSIAYIPLSRGMYALVDAEDAEYLSQWSWLTIRCSHSYYAARQERMGGKRLLIRMHAQLLGISGRRITGDHVCCERTLDNRRANLRRATPSQQLANQRLRSTSTSGYKGVSFHRITGKWQASIRKDGQTRYLGLFESAQAAHDKYAEAARQLFGEFARAA